jgi:small subunit ribosomal protein S17
MMAENLETQERTTQTPRKPRRMLVGRVTSAHKTPKTIRVEAQYLDRHRKYGKYLRRSARLHVHDEKQEAKLGDQVQVMECRPVSRTKTWRLVRVLESAPQD